MRICMFLYLQLALAGFQKGAAQHQVHLKITGVTNNEGKICVALYNTSDSFLKYDDVYRGVSETSVKGTAHIVFKDIPKGTYAVAIFHDSNGNGKLDTNWLGVPKEEEAFSIANMKTFGPPGLK